MNANTNGVTCKKCGQTGLVWKEGKSGKFYLAHVTRRANVSDSFIPHFKSCSVANAERDSKVLADEQEYNAEVREFMVWDSIQGKYLDTRTGQPWIGKEGWMKGR